MAKAYETTQPDRSEIDAMPGIVAVDFGTNWCGYCRSAEPDIATALAAHPDIRHIKVEDGPGRKLGRSFKVKLWPTVVFVKGGVELSRVVRPESEQEVSEALEQAARA
ncbi:thioredoxin family protein [Pseudoduganella sp. GCM10020061]|uniref:thioredoxin family protein n=1 Tax=Pseudoduganella sp. GCM10020061 TaxID=3317345 RepID=UPI0036282A10